MAATQWTAAGCVVESTGGNCIGFGCVVPEGMGKGLVPVGLVNAADGHYECEVACPTDNAAFTVTAKGKANVICIDKIFQFTELNYAADE